MSTKTKTCEKIIDGSNKPCYNVIFSDSNAKKSDLNVGSYKFNYQSKSSTGIIGTVSEVRVSYYFYRQEDHFQVIMELGMSMMSHQLCHKNPGNQ